MDLQERQTAPTSGDNGSVHPSQSVHPKHYFASSALILKNPTFHLCFNENSVGTRSDRHDWDIYCVYMDLQERQTAPRSGGNGSVHPSQRGHPKHNFVTSVCDFQLYIS